MVLPEIAMHLENGLFGSRKANYDNDDDLLLSLSSALLLPSLFFVVSLCLFFCFLYSLLQYL